MAIAAICVQQNGCHTPSLRHPLLLYSQQVHTKSATDRRSLRVRFVATGIQPPTHSDPSSNCLQSTSLHGTLWNWTIRNPGCVLLRALWVMLLLLMVLMVTLLPCDTCSSASNWWYGYLEVLNGKLPFFLPSLLSVLFLISVCLEQECLEQSDALLRLLCRELGVPLSRVRVNLEHDNPVTRNRGGREGAPTTVSSMGKES